MDLKLSSSANLSNYCDASRIFGMDIPYSEKELISRTSFNRFDEQIILRSQEEREKEKKILENIIYTFCYVSKGKSRNRRKFLINLIVFINNNVSIWKNFQCYHSLAEGKKKKKKKGEI